MKANTIVYERLLLMENNSDFIVFDGKMISANQPVVPATSRGLMYGDGVFETLRIYSGRTFFLQKHIDRLKSGCKLLEVSVDDQLGLESIKGLIHNLLHKNGLLDSDAVIRLQVWRAGDRGFDANPEAGSHFSITASCCPEDFPNPKLATVKTRRIPSEALPSAAKLTNSINYILAAREASKKGADDALMQTTEGWVSETTIANIFWVKDDIIFTPSTDCDLIPGIKRNIVLQLADKVTEGQFKLNDITDADAVFITNSVREILPARQLDSQPFDTENEVLKQLKKRFNRFRDLNLKPLDV